MIEISLILNSARKDFSLIGLKDTFIFSPTILTLNKQQFREFELIIVDACYSESRRKWIEQHANFQVKYISAFPNRFLERGMCAIASMKNLGLKFAQGELVMFVDDCTQFPPDWTKRIWGWYEKGYWPMSLTYYWEGGKPKLLRQESKHVIPIHPKEDDREQRFSTFLRQGEMVRDSRAKFVDERRTMQVSGSWFYGGSSATLEALLRINGLDERFDGSKALEDVDVGIRLENAGYAGKFILDKDLYHVENWHQGVSERVLSYKGPTPKCNYALLQYNVGNPVANKKVLTRDDCDWIRNNICPKCNNLGRCLNEEFRGKFYVESDGFNSWLELQRTFDLRGEWGKIRG